MFKLNLCTWVEFKFSKVFIKTIKYSYPNARHNLGPEKKVQYANCGNSTYHYQSAHSRESDVTTENHVQKTDQVHASTQQESTGKKCYFSTFLD